MSKSRQLDLDPLLVLGLLTSQKDERFRADTIAALTQSAGSGEAQLQIMERFGNSQLIQAEEALRRALDRGLSVCAFGQAHYPSLLAEIYDPPPILFYLGDLECLSKPTLAIVGSRSADRNGCDIASEMASSLADAGVTVVSGLALGVDGAAHSGALSKGVPGSTVAVLGNGLPAIYPRRHERLAQNIIEADGCILSQFEPDTAAFPSNFLNRNRLIAGLSLGALVVQADLRSGSLVTARYASEEGREVLAIPGAITDARHKGTNSLIRQGAALVTSIEDIFEAIPALGTLTKSEIKRQSAIDPRLSKLVSINDGAPHDLFEIEQMIGEADLLELELQGLIERLPGNQIRIIS